MLQSVKDAMTAKAAQLYVNNRIARYGRVNDLKIDSRRKTVEFACQLDGEAEPVLVRIDRYAISAVGEQHFLEVQAVSCSRPWLHHLLEDFSSGRRVAVPGWAATAL